MGRYVVDIDMTLANNQKPRRSLEETRHSCISALGDVFPA